MSDRHNRRAGRAPMLWGIGLVLAYTAAVTIQYALMDESKKVADRELLSMQINR